MGARRRAPTCCRRRLYGLCEWHGAVIRSAPIIANPGCYPTAVLLPLLPLAAAGLLCGTVIAHAMSGITGAGRKVSADYLFTELSENVTAYAPGRSHRHYAEMIAQLGAVAPDLGLLFTPHLVPMRRGLAAHRGGDPARTPSGRPRYRRARAVLPRHPVRAAYRRAHPRHRRGVGRESL